jgi:hypothetical protein
MTGQSNHLDVLLLAMDSKDETFHAIQKLYQEDIKFISSLVDEAFQPGKEVAPDRDDYHEDLIIEVFPHCIVTSRKSLGDIVEEMKMKGLRLAVCQSWTEFKKTLPLLLANSNPLEATRAGMAILTDEMSKGFSKDGEAINALSEYNVQGSKLYLHNRKLMRALLFDSSEEAYKVRQRLIEINKSLDALLQEDLLGLHRMLLERNELQQQLIKDLDDVFALEDPMSAIAMLMRVFEDRWFE